MNKRDLFDLLLDAIWKVDNEPSLKILEGLIRNKVKLRFSIDSWEKYIKAQERALDIQDFMIDTYDAISKDSSNSWTMVCSMRDRINEITTYYRPDNE